MDRQAKQRAILQRLHTLPAEERVAYALELLDKEHGMQVVSAALSVLAPAALPQARPILLQQYIYYDAAGIKRDPGSPLRSAILAALFPIAKVTDATLAERATLTYEFLPPTHEESVSGLRAAGLTLLAKLDPELAHYHSVRLLNDLHTSRMSGEPAVSAVRHLTDFHQTLPLYAYVFCALHGGQSQPDVMGEALRSLPEAPLSVIDPLLSRYTALVPEQNMPRYETRDDIELVGLFDLLLAQTPGTASLAFMERFLRTTYHLEVYSYLASMIVVQRQPAVWTMLQRVARTERDRAKAALLCTAFAPMQDDPALAGLLDMLQRQAAAIQED